MTQSQDLEFVYAEIKHHLDNVLADETITTIIQMLKDYPKLKEKLDELQQSHDTYVKEVWNQHMDLEQYKAVIDEIKNFAEDGKGFDGRFVKEGKDEVWKHYNEDLKEILSKTVSNKGSEQK